MIHQDIRGRMLQWIFHCKLFSQKVPFFNPSGIFLWDNKWLNKMDTVYYKLLPPFRIKWLIVVVRVNININDKLHMERRCKNAPVCYIDNIALKEDWDVTKTSILMKKDKLHNCLYCINNIILFLGFFIFIISAFCIIY